jgi:DNA polymerase-1
VNGNHLLLIDGSGYMYRAYYALPPIKRRADGVQINAVLGFCNMLWKLLRDFKSENIPTHLAVIFDKSRITFRTALYPAYQSTRPEISEDLRSQLGLVREAVHAFNIPAIEQDGFEADDLIATYTRQASNSGFAVTIASSDKDLMQLVSSRVVLYDTMKGCRIGRPEVIKKFGVPPEKVADVQALVGDAVDNVPGVSGIGMKTAARLITEYGDLETVLALANQIKRENLRFKLIENAHMARLSKALVALQKNVELDVPLTGLCIRKCDANKLITFLKTMECETLARRIAKWMETPIATADVGKACGFFAPAPVSPNADAPDMRQAQGDLFPERT